MANELGVQEIAIVTDQELVTSRSPDDRPAFSKIVEESAEGRHEVHDEGAAATAGS